MRYIYSLHEKGGPARYIGVTDDVKSSALISWTCRNSEYGSSPLSVWLRGLKKQPAHTILVVVCDADAEDTCKRAVLEYQGRYPGQLINPD